MATPITHAVITQDILSDRWTIKTRRGETTHHTLTFASRNRLTRFMSNWQRAGGYIAFVTPTNLNQWRVLTK